MKKICAIVSEFNPFHNGHKYLIEQAKQLSGCDRVLCIMSASFTQRGDIAILDKFTRATHAVSNGADCVIELPVPFTVAPAEIFAKGAIKILASIPEIDCLAFGCENADEMISVYDRLQREQKNIDETLKKYLSEGNGYAKSYACAYADCVGGDNVFTPNNILAIEYARAVSLCGRNITLIPIQRVGGHYKDNDLKENFSSASAIRLNLRQDAVKKNIPNDVFKDLQRTMYDINKWQTFQKYALLCANEEKLKDIYGCTEGLEHRLKNLETLTTEALIDEITGKRYSASRIRRIITANALNLSKLQTETFLNNAGYIKPLAVRREAADEILSSLSKSPYPVVIRQRDLNALDDISREMFDKCIFADRIWSEVSDCNVYNFTLKII